MSKLSDPVASRSLVPFLRPAPPVSQAFSPAQAAGLAQGIATAGRLAYKTPVPEVLEGRYRSTYDQEDERPVPQIEAERQRSYFRSANARGEGFPAYGASATFLAQLIGQAVPQADTSKAGAVTSDPAFEAYRTAEGPVAARIGEALNFAV